MNYSEDEDSAENRDETWHGLDEAQLRMSVRELVSGIAEQELDNRPRMIRQLARVREVVQEEIATAAQSDLNLYVEYQDTSSAAACARLADDVNKELAALGIAFAHPLTGAAAQLGVSRVPPTDAQSWLQIEALDPSTSTPYRLASPNLEKLSLRPEPTRSTTHSAGSGRAR